MTKQIGQWTLIVLACVVLAYVPHIGRLIALLTVAGLPFLILAIFVMAMIGLWRILWHGGKVLRDKDKT